MYLSANPSELSQEDRREIRLARESVKFDIDHYMADFMDDEMIQEILKYKLTWENLDSSTPNPGVQPAPTIVLSVPGSSESTFSDLEKEMLRKLPNKEYLMNKEEQRVAMLNLVDILLAFAYDLRTTFGEHTVESSWTVAIISSVFSSGEVIQSILYFPINLHLINIMLSEFHFN